MFAQHLSVSGEHRAAFRHGINALGHPPCFLFLGFEPWGLLSQETLYLGVLSAIVHSDTPVISLDAFLELFLGALQGAQVLCFY